MDWELVGYGRPTAGDYVTRRAASLDWTYLDSGIPHGGDFPPDRECQRSTEAVIEVTRPDGSKEYLTVHLDFMDSWDEFDEYIEDYWLEQYE